MGNGPPWEMDPPEHIHGHLLGGGGGSISHGGPFPMQQFYCNCLYLFIKLINSF